MHIHRNIGEHGELLGQNGRFEGEILFMHKQQSFNFQRAILGGKRSKVVIGQVCVVLGLAALFFVGGMGSSVVKAFAQSSCSDGAHAYVVVDGDTLAGIAAHYHVDWQTVASANHLDDPNLILPGQTICISSTGVSVSHAGAIGHANLFPAGQCTWWADQRYHELTGVYVPWTTNADAWEWTARAREFHWHVSSKPTVGAIMDLQPWVQGAYEYGHVAVVEKILSNGHVLASNMNWGGNGSHVVDVEFTPASGVTFITY